MYELLLQFDDGHKPETEKVKTAGFVNDAATKYGMHSIGIEQGIKWLMNMNSIEGQISYKELCHAYSIMIDGYNDPYYKGKGFTIDIVKL